MYSNDPEEVRSARIAIADIGFDRPMDVIPELIIAFEGNNRDLTRHAARMLANIHVDSGLLPKELRERISPFFSD